MDNARLYALIESCWAQNHSALTQLLAGQVKIMATLQDIQDAQSAETAVIGTISTEVTAASERINDLTEQLATAVANQADPTVIQGIVDSMHVATANATAAATALQAALPAPVVALAPADPSAPGGSGGTPA